MRLLFLSICLSVLNIGYSQTDKTLEFYGPTYAIDHPDFKVDLNQEFKAVFDIAKGAESKGELNKLFQTLARYIKLHSDSDLDNNSVKAAMVIHGSAVFDLLNHDEYAKHHQQKGLKNPNLELLSILSKQNVEIILCGQTSKHRMVSKNMIHPEVQIALSAMTALIELQNHEYRLINF